MSSQDGGTASLRKSRKTLRASVVLLREIRALLSASRTAAGLSRFKAWRDAGIAVQHQGRPYRVLYAFDPRRMALLLIGGDKTGNDRWYEEFVPLADKIFDQHLEWLEEEKNR
jgi:hypothetical protein